MGIKYAGDPSWFYTLTPQERINVLALSRIESAANNPRQRPQRAKLAPQVKADKAGRDFWMGD